MARMMIELPADAKLFVDDQAMKSTSAHREFTTPALEIGATYYYDVRAELVLDGQKHTSTKRVILHAGDIVQASFPDLQRLATANAEATTTASR